MPLGPVAEVILQPVAELVLNIIGYLTARVIVPLFTLGLVHVEPGPHKEFVRPRFGGIKRMDGKLIMDAELGALFGVIFWFTIAISAFAYFNN